MSNSDFTYFIHEELRKAGIETKGNDASRRYIMAYCFRGHDNKTASLKIEKSDGRFYCFGCGIHGTCWNELASHIGGTILGEHEMPDPWVRLNQEIKDVLDAPAISPALPWDIEPWTKGWRKISSYTMNAADAYRWYDDPLQCYRVLLPITMYGKLRGWTARRIDKKEEMKYRNMPRMHSTKLLYPLDIVAQMNTDSVALVEGPVDALTLLDRDIPALAILGTKNYRDGNRVHLLNLEIKRVVIAMDPESGDEARTTIYHSLKNWFKVEHYYCPSERDPGDLPRREYRRLWRQVNRPTEEG